MNDQGGMTYRCSGVCQNPQMKPPKNPGEENQATLDVAFFGGKQYIKLANPNDLAKCRDGQPITIQGPLKQFKDSMYPGPGEVVEAAKPK